ncbi:MAG: ferredoxin reductase [Pseudomonadota bacterium]|jgi:NAD(P)H-flavin reductase/ferredoxin
MAQVEFNQQVFALEEGLTLLSALDRHGLNLPRGCQAGVCQGCLVQITEGDIPPRAQEGLTAEQKNQGLVMACMCAVSGPLRAQTPGAGAHKRYACEVVRQRWLKGDILQLCVSKPGLNTGAEAFDFRAGQFVRLLPDAQPDSAGRCYSLASLPAETHLEFHIRILPNGIMSNHLAALPVGAPLWLQGPMGRCFYQAQSLEQPLLLAAIGTGMAPIFGVARAAVQAGHRGPIYCVMGAKEESGLYPLPGLHQVACATNIHLVYIVQQAGAYSDTYEVGDIYQKIRTLLPSMKGAQAYICGAPSFVQTLKKQCYLAGARLDEIFSDAFLPS